MKRKPIVAAVSAALGVTVLSSAACAGATVESVEFIGMPAPATAASPPSAAPPAPPPVAIPVWDGTLAPLLGGSCPATNASRAWRTVMSARAAPA